VRRRDERPLVALAALLWIAAVVAALLVQIGEDHGLLGNAFFPGVPRLPETACPGQAIGVDSTLAFESDDRGRAETVTAIRKFLRPQVVRDALLWHQVEPVQGQFNWSVSDSIVADLREAGIEPLLVVLGSPPWANGVPLSTPQHYLYVPPRGPALDAWLAHYSDFLAAAVERYKGFVRRWEIWNEPNMEAFWHPRPDPAAYRQMYETLRRTILMVDPNAEVSVGGLGGLTSASPPSIPGRSFLRRLARTDQPLGTVAIHPYATSDHAPGVHVPGENNFDDVAAIRRLLAAEGEKARIWVTEWGWSSATVGRRRQAHYLNQSLEMLRRHYPFVRLATYFVDRNLPPQYFQGLLTQDLKPKPAARVFRRYADLAASRCAAGGDSRQRPPSRRANRG
jgi:polysaccharide biosynthesis protein PslG